MENASKALSMAASVLIGLLLLSLLIFAYYQITEMPRQEEENAKFEQTIEFNQIYLAYDKTDLKGNKLISLCNRVIDNNIKYQDISGYQITIIVKNPGSGVNGFNLTPTSTEGYYAVKDNIKNNTYKCTDIEYGGTDGRISKMTFEQINEWGKNEGLACLYSI